MRTARMLEARAPFRDVLMWRNLPRRRAARYISVSGEPTFDARGRFTGYRGIGRDITKQKRIQQLLKLDHAVTLRLAEGRARRALNGALEAICDSLRWDAAAGRRRRRPACCAASPTVARPARPARLVEASASAFARQSAAHGRRASRSGSRIGADRARAAPRRSPGDRAARRGDLPGPRRRRIAAVLEFTSRRIRQPDNRLWQTLGAIGTQIGQFLGRAEAERAVRESEARLRALTHLSSDWYWEQDAEFRFTRLEGRQVAGGDPELQRAPDRPAPLGKRPGDRGRLGRAPRRCSRRASRSTTF